MKHIGTTATGLLVEITAAEVATIQAALAVLGEIGGTAPACIPPPPPPERRTGRPLKAVIQGEDKTCSICGKTKPASDFYAVGKQCRACLREKAKAKYQPKTKRAQVAKAKESPVPPRRSSFVLKSKPLAMNEDAKAKRLAALKEAGRRIAERAPNLDRPISHGRVEPVGAQE